MKKETKNTRCPCTIEAFTKYLHDNPEQRFFQALINFTGFYKIGYLQDDKFYDLWYWEEE